MILLLIYNGLGSKYYLSEAKCFICVPGIQREMFRKLKFRGLYEVNRNIHNI